MEVLSYALKRQGHEKTVLMPVYLSVNGFHEETEKLLHEQEKFLLRILKHGVE